MSTGFSVLLCTPVKGHELAPTRGQVISPSTIAAIKAPRAVQQAIFWWAGVLLVLCLWELGTWFIGKLAPIDAATFPPLTEPLQPLFDSDSSRRLMMIAWLAACAALIKVVRRPCLLS
ncbi:hypothetical protein AAGW05_18105 [Arthrobacter sp. LAPM80]|uniref:hypothetical protein n=1 Tax=Arthrobacter sp. LAPM80 TaxID=3141788 RepID=UPI00398AE770